MTLAEVRALALGDGVHIYYAKDDDPERVGRDVYGAEVVYDWGATADTAHVYREKGGYRVEISPEAGYDYEGPDIVSRASRSQDVVHILDEYRRTHRKGNPWDAEVSSGRRGSASYSPSGQGPKHGPRRPGKWGWSAKYNRRRKK